MLFDDSYSILVRFGVAIESFLRDPKTHQNAVTVIKKYRFWYQIQGGVVRDAGSETTPKIMIFMVFEYSYSFFIFFLYFFLYFFILFYTFYTFT